MLETGLKVSDAMTVSPYHVPSSMSLSDCASEMANRHVGALIVKDADKLVGLITEQDIVRKAIAVKLDHTKTTVGDIMETRLLTITPEADISKALVKMRDANIRHLPVKTDDELHGLLTLKDILKIQPQLFELLVDKFELREEERKRVNRNIPGEGICELCGNYAESLSQNSDGAMSCDECR